MASGPNSGLKETELGPIPYDWEVPQISSFARTATGGTPSRKRPEFFRGRVPWVKSGELDDSIVSSTQETITSDGLQNSSAKLFPPGTLLMALYGATTGKVGILAIEAATNQAVCAIFPDDSLADTGYLFYALIHRRPDLLTARYGGAQPNISQTLVRNLKLPLPPLPEQRAIAHVLRTVQRAKEATEKVIAATRTLKQSLMRHLFTYGPVPSDQADQVELKDTEIGGIPKYWEDCKLEGFIEKPQYGLTASAIQDPLGPRFLRITDIQDDNVAWETVPYCQCDQADRQKYKLGPGDLVVARIGATTGKTFLVKAPPEAVFASYLIRIRAKRGLVSEFLYQFTKTKQYWDQINAAKGGRLKGGVNIPVVRNLTIPLPPQQEQHVIAKALEACDAEITVEEGRSLALQGVFQTLLHNLLSGKVRVHDLDLGRSKGR